MFRLERVPNNNGALPLLLFTGAWGPLAVVAVVPVRVKAGVQLNRIDGASTPTGEEEEAAPLVALGRPIISTGKEIVSGAATVTSATTTIRSFRSEGAIGNAPPPLPLLFWRAAARRRCSTAAPMAAKASAIVGHSAEGTRTESGGTEPLPEELIGATPPPPFGPMCLSINAACTGAPMPQGRGGSS